LFSNPDTPEHINPCSAIQTRLNTSILVQQPRHA
jgi:hypothetical protein